MNRRNLIISPRPRRGEITSDLNDKTVLTEITVNKRINPIVAKYAVYFNAKTPVRKKSAQVF